MSQPPDRDGDAGRAQGDAWLIVATLNTRGVPVTGSQLAGRYRAIGEAFEGCDADVVAFQEVFTYGHLRLLARRMSSFRHVAYRPSAAGPAGGLVTFSRLPVSACTYRGLGFPAKAPGVSWAVRARAWLKGVLLTELPGPQLVHLLPALQGRGGALALLQRRAHCPAGGLRGDFLPDGLGRAVPQMPAVADLHRRGQRLADRL